MISREKKKIIQNIYKNQSKKTLTMQFYLNNYNKIQNFENI
jgi:hypothetical protein